MSWNEKAMLVGEALVDWKQGECLPFRQEAIYAIYGTVALRGRAVYSVQCCTVDSYRYEVVAVMATGSWGDLGSRIEFTIPAEAFFDYPVGRYPDVVQKYMYTEDGEVGGDSDEN